MTRTRIKVFTLAALLSVASVVLGGNVENDALKEIAGYRQWTRVTEKPLPVISTWAVA